MRNPLRILLLILAGEATFILPFVLARVFRPTFLAVFDITNTELGNCYALYGMIALVSYFFGGTVADRFPPRKLMALSLLLTSLGGFYLYTLPSYSSLLLLYVYWGFTTLFLFWSAMIKATRDWGGVSSQGKAFGFLEGGRGFIAASLGAIGVSIFSYFLPADSASLSAEIRQNAFQLVILISAFFCAAVGGFIMLFFKDSTASNSQKISSLGSWEKIKKAIAIPSVHYLMIIVLSAYVGYKVTDVFSLYAAEIMLFDEVKAAQVGSYQMYLRPLICILVGVFADKTKASKVLVYAFGCSFIGALLFASGSVIAPHYSLFGMSLIITAIGTYGLRAVYYAVMEEGQIPFYITGTAVGLISLVGYTPDIFVGPIMGYFLDNFEGIWGHQQLFLFLAFFSLLGLWAAYRFRKLSTPKR